MKASTVHAEARLESLLYGGPARLNVLSPSPDFMLNDGYLLGMRFEKSINILNLYLEAGIEYMHTTGRVNYNYVSPTTTYNLTSINTTFDQISGLLGLRLKPIDNGPVRVFFGGGGTGGYFQLTYDNSLSSQAAALGSDYRTLDDAVAFGLYGEVGLEVDLSHTVGLTGTYRYDDVNTRPITTVKNESLHYCANTMAAGLLFKF